MTEFNSMEEELCSLLPMTWYMALIIDDDCPCVPNSWKYLRDYTTLVDVCNSWATSTFTPFLFWWNGVNCPHNRSLT